jgi:tetratricopeptide (TPR) repeat protein
MLLLVIASEGPVSASDLDWLNQANAAVKEGLHQQTPLQARTSFARAASCYEKAAQEGFQNAALYRNLGNAYLLSGDLPQAILAYRRGLRLVPDDPWLQANLTAAREQVAYPTPGRLGRPPGNGWPPWLPRPASGWLLLASVLLYSLSGGAMTRWWMTRRTRYLTPGLGLLALSLVLWAILVYQHRQGDQERLHPLVVIQHNGVLLRNGNGMTYPVRYDGVPLNRGVEARVLFARADWLHLELAGGETGWVPAGDVLLDTP